MAAILSQYQCVLEVDFEATDSAVQSMPQCYRDRWVNSETKISVCLPIYLEHKTNLTRPTLNADKPSATLDP